MSVATMTPEAVAAMGFDDAWAFDGLAIRDSWVGDCPHVSLDAHDNARLYYLPSSHGFDFLVLEFSGCSSEAARDWWRRGAWLHVKMLLRGVAYFDGVRHLDAGIEPDHTGYIYYPGTETLAAAFNALADLERKYCPESGAARRPR